MVSLVGAHQDIVEDLVHRFDAISGEDPESVRIILLKAPSGWGKTAIIQELYERLRARQTDSSRYWPPLIQDNGEEPDGVASDPLRTRKVIAPSLSESFMWDSGVLPSYGWWGIECYRNTCGAFADSSNQLKEQLSQHGVPLSLSRTMSMGFLGKTKESAENIIREVHDNFLEYGLEAALEVIPSPAFFGPFVKFIRSGVLAIKNAREDKSNWLENVDLSAALMGRRASLGEELGEAISDLARESFPQVVAIEDLQFASSDVFSFLDSISRLSKGRPVMVVATAGDVSGDNKEYDRWLASARDDSRVSIVNVPKLTNVDLGDIILQYAPNTPKETLDCIVEKCDNPYHLTLWLSSATVQKNIRENPWPGAVVLGDKDDNSTLLKSLESLLSQRWNELPAKTQMALMFAVAINPTKDDVSYRFNPESVARIMEKVERLDLDYAPAVYAFTKSAVSLGWCRFEKDSEFFTERMLLDTVRTNALDFFKDDEFEQMRNVLRDQLAENVQMLFKNRKQEFTYGDLIDAQWYLTLSNNEMLEEKESTKFYALYIIAKSYGDNFHFAQAIMKMNDLVEKLKDRPDCTDLMLMDLAQTAQWAANTLNSKVLYASLARIKEVSKRSPDFSKYRDIASVMMMCADVQHGKKIDKYIPVLKNLLASQERDKSADPKQTLIIRAYLTLAYLGGTSMNAISGTGSNEKAFVQEGFCMAKTVVPALYQAEFTEFAILLQIAQALASYLIDRKEETIKILEEVKSYDQQTPLRGISGFCYDYLQLMCADSEYGNDPKRVLAECERAIAKWKPIFGETSLRLAQISMIRAMYLPHSQRPKEWADVISSYEKAEYDNPAFILELRNLYADALIYASRVDEALEEYKRLLSLAEKILPESNDTRQRIGRRYSSLIENEEYYRNHSAEYWDKQEANASQGIDENEIPALLFQRKIVFWLIAPIVLSVLVVLILKFTLLGGKAWIAVLSGIIVFLVGFCALVMLEIYRQFARDLALSIPSSLPSLKEKIHEKMSRLMKLTVWGGLIVEFSVIVAITLLPVGTTLIRGICAAVVYGLFILAERLGEILGETFITVK